MPSASDSPSPAAVVTSVRWEGVTGARLEELLYGLFDELGAVELIWRAGAAEGVTAADGGRDLEAVFSEPDEAGGSRQTRYWIEAKGRSGTVPKSAVVDAVNNLTAYPEVDVFVMCTNGRYTNPTRDWVEKWQQGHPRPEVRLWDRDHLSRLVRDHPVVAARSLPEALDDGDRLELLLDRFVHLGETPSPVDLTYFWSRREAVRGSQSVVPLVAMFAYAEDHPDLVIRPWATLLPDDELRAAEAVVYAVLEVPRWGLRDLARPVHSAKSLETAAYILIGVMDRVRAELIHDILTDPGSVFEDVGPFGRSEVYAHWRDLVVKPLWARVKDELGDGCASDCVRVTREPSAFPAALTGKNYWRRFGVGDEGDDWFLRIEDTTEPCLVGLNLGRERSCPLFQEDADLDLRDVQDLRTVVIRRREQPDGLWKAYRHLDE